MGELDLLNLSKTVLVSATLVSMPILVAVGAVGLVVSLIQALTQVQEQSLSFVPKQWTCRAGTGSQVALNTVRDEDRTWSINAADDAHRARVRTRPVAELRDLSWRSLYELS